MLLFNLLEEDTILERVDEYSIYSFYIGKELELGGAHTSPLHDDKVPSFSLYSYGDKIFFKDHALAGMSGGVFKFVKELFGYKTLNDALSRINVDFDLELSGGNPKITKSGEKAKHCKSVKERDKLLALRILSKKVVSKEFEVFWSQYGITKTTLKFYYATEPEHAQFIYKKQNKVIIFKELTIAYRIQDKYQIYAPYAPRYRKFRNNFPMAYILGYLQLKYEKNFLVITKAFKEIMFLREHFDWDAVSGKSETTLIRKHMMLKLMKKYKYIFIWLDSDVPGQVAQKAYLEQYPFLIPIFYKAKHKDPTDEYSNSPDKERVLSEIKQLIMSRVETV